MKRLPRRRILVSALQIAMMNDVTIKVRKEVLFKKYSRFFNFCSNFEFQNLRRVI